MPKKIIDLRSDTVTQPTPAMRQAMLEAELGDDVFGEDPTVKRLEALAAEMLGKEAGLPYPLCPLDRALGARASGPLFAGGTPALPGG